MPEIINFVLQRASACAGVPQAASGLIVENGQKPWVDPDDAPKQPVSVRLDPDARAKLRADGSGWQARPNGILRQALAG